MHRRRLILSFDVGRMVSGGKIVDDPMVTDSDLFDLAESIVATLDVEGLIYHTADVASFPDDPHGDFSG